MEKRNYNIFLKILIDCDTLPSYTSVAENKERVEFLLKEELDNKSKYTIDDFEIVECDIALSDNGKPLEERFTDEHSKNPWYNGSTLIRWNHIR